MSGLQATRNIHVEISTVTIGHANSRLKLKSHKPEKAFVKALFLVSSLLALGNQKVVVPRPLCHPTRTVMLTIEGMTV